MATSCLRPRILSSQSGLHMWQCSKKVLASGVRGHLAAVSELRSSLALPDFGLLRAVILHATWNSTHRAASPQRYPHPRRSSHSRTWSVHVARRCRLRTLVHKWHLRCVWAWSERLVRTD